MASSGRVNVSRNIRGSYTPNGGMISPKQSTTTGCGIFAAADDCVVATIEALYI
jgi:hypothetical protein